MAYAFACDNIGNHRTARETKQELAYETNLEGDVQRRESPCLLYENRRRYCYRDYLLLRLHGQTRNKEGGGE